MRDVEPGGAGRYVFLVTWRELADHVERFASSPASQDFGARIGPFLLAAPEVSHVELVAGTDSAR